MIGFQDDADWFTLRPISLPLQSMKTDLRLQRLAGKAQFPTAKMLLGSFPSSFWTFATSCAPTSGENIFSIWIVERIEADDIYKRTHNTEPIPSMNRTRSMFHLYIRHHVMRTTKTLKFNGGKIGEFEHFLVGNQHFFNLYLKKLIARKRRIFYMNRKKFWFSAKKKLEVVNIWPILSELDFIFTFFVTNIFNTDQVIWICLPIRFRNSPDKKSETNMFVKSGSRKKFETFQSTVTKFNIRFIWRNCF